MNIQYTTLNDVFAYGRTEVWYLKPDCTDLRFSPKNLIRTHVLLGSVASSPSTEYGSNDLIGLCNKLQSEFWSPNNEAKELIESKGLKHISMNVGDCFKLQNGKVYVCSFVGKLKNSIVYDCSFVEFGNSSSPING